jgi:hypothetical protein
MDLLQIILGNLKNCTPLDVLSVIFSFIAVVLALSIPKKIMVNQIYADLLNEYRSFEFGEAITALINFYINDCNREVSQITSTYKCRYDREEKDIKNSLHFKRRLLWQYYWDISRLRYEYGIFGISKQRIAKNFTKKESNLIGLLYHTVEGAKICFDDIVNVPEPECQDGKTEKAVYRLYEESKGW